MNVFRASCDLTTDRLVPSIIVLCIRRAESEVKIESFPVPNVLNGSCNDNLTEMLLLTLRIDCVLWVERMPLHSNTCFLRQLR